MRKWTSFLVMAMVVTGCSWAAPDPGHESVLVRKPIIFGHGGVESDPVKPGLQFVAVTTNVIDVNMQPQQFGVHFEDLMSSDGVPLDFDSVIRVKVTDSVMLVKSFGPEWYKNNVEAEFVNRVRQAVRKHGMNETAIDTKAIDAIDAEVSAAMEEHFNTAGLPLKLIQVTMGKANPPDSIKDQRVETATQQQRQLTEQQRKLAEDQRKMAEFSRADADNAYRNKIGMTPAQFIQLEQIKAMREVCTNATCTFVAGPGVTPVLDVKR